MQNWFDMNYNFFSALELEKWAVFIILSFIVLVACFNVCSTLFVYVIKRFYDIAILKTLGASNKFFIKAIYKPGIIDWYNWFGRRSYLRFYLLHDSKTF